MSGMCAPFLLCIPGEYARNLGRTDHSAFYRTFKVLTKDSDRLHFMHQPPGFNEHVKEVEVKAVGAAIAAVPATPLAFATRHPLVPLPLLGRAPASAMQYAGSSAQADPRGGARAVSKAEVALAIDLASSTSSPRRFLGEAGYW